MKSLLVMTLALVSVAAHAGTGSLNCEVRTTKGGKAVATKTVNVAELTSSSIPEVAKNIQIGTVGEISFEVSFKGHYANKAVLALSAKTTGSSKTTIETFGTAENVLGLTLDNKDEYFSVLCREAIAE